MIYNNLDISRLSDDEVLFLVRIHGKKGMFGVLYPDLFLQEFKGLKEYRTISEYNVGDVHIDIKNQDLGKLTNRHFQIFEEALDIEDLIVRCRGLREISYHEARQLIWKAAQFFVDYYSQHPSLKLIVSIIVDNYVLDVMVRLAEYFNIKHIQLVGFFVPGYVRFTEKGIGVPVREVGEEEINKVYERLVNKKPSHMAVSKSSALKNAARDYISYHYRYIVRYILGYKINGDLSYEYRFAKYFYGFNTVSKLFVSKFFDRIDTLTIDPERSVFIPIHFHPEATVDYWTDNKEHADYLNSLLEVIAFFKEKNMTVVFKEHPNYYLRRSRSFYKTLKKFDNVILLEPYISSQDLYNKIDNVCVYTGSAGVESLMLDKRVYTVSENYYSFSRLPFLKEFSFESYPYYSVEEKKELIHNILKTTIKINA